jgi:hypothetical protein
MDNNKPTYVTGNEPEMKHIAFTSYKSKSGFTWNVTVRDNEIGQLRDAMNNWEDYITMHEGEPLNGQRGPGRPPKVEPVNPLPWEDQKAINEVMAKPESPEVKCEKCGAKGIYKEGVSQKTGKPWKAIFCSTEDKSHATWL